MLGGEGSVVRSNYVHDLNMGIDDAPGVDPNLVDGVTNLYRFFSPALDMDPAFDTENNIVASYTGPQDPRYIDLGFANIAGTAASDFNLVKAGSPAVDAGASIAGNTLDYFNRARPNGGALDIGALEFGSYQTKCIPRFRFSRTSPR
jgi:hypothetical protein